MKKLLLLLLCFAINALSWRTRRPRDSAMNRGLYLVDEIKAEQAPASNDEYLRFKQRLDHFGAGPDNFFFQRYQVNQTFATNGGPAFLLLGGEGPIATKWLATDTMIMLYAKRYGASVFQLEHRFYGKTQPFGNWDVESLRYLSSQQALADAADFVTWASSSAAPYSLTPTTKWVVFGGSYSGALAAWMRLKYPHLVVGAVASSAPVVPELDFRQYLEVVQEAILSTSNGTACLETVRQEFRLIEKLLATVEGRRQLDDVFRPCHSLRQESGEKLELDSAQFIEKLVSVFQDVVQYSQGTEKDVNATIVNVEQLCSRLIHSPGAPLSKLAEARRHAREAQGEVCLDSSNRSAMDRLQNTTVGDDIERPWTYQTCNEFGFYQTTDGDSEDQPFGTMLPLKRNLKVCSAVFGIENVRAHTLSTLTTFGGTAIADVTSNIVFPNGSLDPWHILGVLKTTNPHNSALLIEGTSHCADMYAPRPSDSLALRQAREKIQALIGQMLHQ